MPPLSNVGIAIEALPYTIAVLQTIVPLSIINLSVVPLVYAFAFCLPHLVLTVVGVTIGILFEASTLSQVILPFALILPPVLVPHQTFSVPFTVIYLTNEDCVWEFPDREAI